MQSIRQLFPKCLCVSFAFWVGLAATSDDQFFKELMAMLSSSEADQIFEKSKAEVLSTPEIQRKERVDFYQEYLAKYYPKVNVICYQQFVKMAPDDVEAALQSIIDLLCYEPFFYFMNDPKGFKITRYWEFIVDQLSYMSDFLGKAQVNIAQKTVFMPSDDDDLMWGFSFTKRSPAELERLKNIKPLKGYLTAPGKTVLYDFYALAFDYVIKLFNEGILMQDVSQADHYLSDLRYLGQRLRGSSHEQEYTEAIKTAQDLMSLLKHKLGFSNNVDDDSRRRG